MDSIEAVKREECGCCGMWEDCTMGYIGFVKQRFGGIWVCGLCEEAIKDEQARLGVDVDMALRVHATFIETANADPAVHVLRSTVKLVKKIMCSATSQRHPK